MGSLSLQHFIYLFVQYYSAMGSEFTTPADRTLSPRLNDGTFRAFVHDTHHAYLLLHRAFQSIPPTVIPDIVPASPTGHGDLDQPDYLRLAHSPLLSMDEDEENDVFKTLTDQDLPHRMANSKLPQPVGRCVAPEAMDVPIPNSAMSKSPLRAVPKPSPRRRHRSTGNHLDQDSQGLRRTAKGRNISRSHSSSERKDSRPWTPEDLAKLRAIKQDKTARPKWATVAGKLARSIDDCKDRWTKIQAEDACK